MLPVCPGLVTAGVVAGCIVFVLLVCTLVFYFLPSSYRPLHRASLDPILPRTTVRPGFCQGKLSLQQCRTTINTG
jgi:hypothetical protein